MFLCYIIFYLFFCLQYDRALLSGAPAGERDPGCPAADETEVGEPEERPAHQAPAPTENPGTRPQATGTDLTVHQRLLPAGNTG